MKQIDKLFYVIVLLWLFQSVLTIVLAIENLEKIQDIQWQLQVLTNIVGSWTEQPFITK